MSAHLPRPRVLLLIVLAMLAFAGNSLLCRGALKYTPIDPASFTLIRLTSGALILAGLVRFRGESLRGAGSWPSALALFAYAAGFSFAYRHLSAGTGALLLFGAVQTTMLGVGLWRGERLNARQSLGLSLALGGLVALLLPGADAPTPLGAALMLGAGIAWGVYSLRGRTAGPPTRATAGNFLRATPMAILLALILLPGDPTALSGALDTSGLLLGLASGALASGLGYALWYAALPALQATQAASVQLSVPVITALGGALWVGESISLRLTLCSLSILGGIGLILRARKP